ncbi:MAG: MBL fold metallo-hydrolase [Clostridia bacterium]|nr:MBL fold metallo-hydrolase [Clostridia bacterium]
MKVIWLGQNGFLFVSGKNKILVDPYLSDSLHNIDIRMERGWSINKKFHTVEPDVIVLTNSHLDHTDIDTLRLYIERNKNQVTLLCCESAFNIIASSGIIGRYNNVLMECGSRWTHSNLIFEAVPAKTDDRSAIGIIITDTTDDKKYYITSDTLYNKNIFKHIPGDIDTLFLPINGEDGCMNMDDALCFANKIAPAHTVPVHFGMFDDVNPKKFKMDGAVVPTIYKIIPLGDESASDISRLSLRKIFAGEEREMKLMLSNKKLLVSDSKIVTEEKKEPVTTPKPYADGITAKEDEKDSNHGFDVVPLVKINEENSSLCKEKTASYEKFEPISVEADDKIVEKTEKKLLEEDAVIKDEIVENIGPVAEEKEIEEPCVTEELPKDDEVIQVEDIPLDMEPIGNEDTEICVTEEHSVTDEVIQVEELTEEDDLEDESPVDSTFDPFAAGDLEGTLEIDSERCAAAFETLESLQELTDDEYDNIDSEDPDMEEYEPYDDSEDEEPYTESYETTEEAVIDEEPEEYMEPEESNAREEAEEIAVDVYENDDFDSHDIKETEDSSLTEEDIPPFDTENDKSFIWEDDTEPMYENEEQSDSFIVEDIEESYESEAEIEEDFESDGEIDADSELIYSDYPEETEGDGKDSEMVGFDTYDDEDMSDKIDAYVKELEKFERGDTVDFSKLEF